MSNMRRNHVRVDSRSPSAQGICQRCGFRYNLTELQYQYQWNGSALINLQILVCPTCLDEPNEQLRVYAPPADPVPVPHPSPDNADMD